MRWDVVMEEDGTITLPPDLLAEMGWTTETLLEWTDDPNGVALAPVEKGADARS